MTKHSSETTYLDILRFLAICLVIYMHSGSIALTAFQNTTNQFTYWFTMYCYPIAQICIPIFFMISGALLLEREETIKDTLSKRFLRTFLLLIFAICIQYAYLYFTEDITPSLLTALKALFTDGLITQHWFLYAYLSMILLLPFLKKLAQSLTEKEYLYLIALQVLFHTIFPMFEAITDFGGISLYLPLLENIIYYPFIGFYLTHKVTLFGTRRSRVILYLSALLTSMVNLWMNQHSWIHGGKIAYVYVFDYLYAISIFLLVQSLFTKVIHPGEKSQKFWYFCRNGILGTYITENILRDLFLPIYIQFFGSGYHVIGVLLWILSVVSTGICISNLMKKIPGFRYIL